jgi:hypothetical protein
MGAQDVLRADLLGGLWRELLKVLEEDTALGEAGRRGRWSEKERKRRGVVLLK